MAAGRGVTGGTTPASFQGVARGNTAPRHGWEVAMYIGGGLLALLLVIVLLIVLF